jgi:hypothetical protein
MITIKNILLGSLFSLCMTPVFASNCCAEMGGVSYCDSSAGRLVCKNGFYSACYCDRHAVMDLQLLKGCCLWKGGILPTYDSAGAVVCRDGSVSEACSTLDSFSNSGMR